MLDGLADRTDAQVRPRGDRLRTAGTAYTVHQDQPGREDSRPEDKCAEEMLWISLGSVNVIAQAARSRTWCFRNEAGTRPDGRGRQRRQAGRGSRGRVPGAAASGGRMPGSAAALPASDERSEERFRPPSERSEWRWTKGDLNPRPLPCEGSDLPADLFARMLCLDACVGTSGLARIRTVDLPVISRVLYQSKLRAPMWLRRTRNDPKVFQATRQGRPTWGPYISGSTAPQSSG